jgi:Periplasmic binding protein
MMPSSSRPDDARSSNLRRYGPIGVIVVIVLIIAVVVIASRGSDKKPATATGSGSSSGSGGAVTASPTGAISFSQAKAQNRTDLKFPDSCDQSTGRVKVPIALPQECYADQPAVTDPGTRGVTDNSITVVVYIPPDQDTVLDYVTGPINNNDTGDQVVETYKSYLDLFASVSQTYGRTLNVKVLRATGSSIDAVAAHADAATAIDTMGAFAVLGSPALTSAFTDDLKAAGVICFECGTGSNSDPSPSAFNTLPSAAQERQIVTEYISKRLNNKPAKFAGDPAMQSQNRVFGHLYIDTGADEKSQAADFKSKMNAAGVKLDTQISFKLDPASLQEQATTVISQFKQAGVTSIIVQGDPISPQVFTTEATSQNYFPEWIIGPTVLIDTTAFARTYDQKQWAHAFGPSALTVRIAPERADWFTLYQWFKGTTPPAIDTAPVLLARVEELFAGIQAAGPRLNATNFREGMFSLPPVSGHLTLAGASFGNHGIWPGDDYNAIDDFTEVWWDPTATGPDEIRKSDKPGMYEYSDGGKRYLPGQWTSDTKAFVKDGAVTIYASPPSGETAKDYPSPASGSSSSSSAN